jgi:sugar transferase (PEP-CTERM/EpsH1 system associated)
MRILYLAHRIPFPPNKGDKIRSFNEVKYLSRKNEIHLICLADNPEDLKYENKLKKYCKSVNTVLIKSMVAKLKSLPYFLSGSPLSVPYFYSGKIQKIIDRLLLTIDFDVIMCFSSPVAEYIFRAKNNNKFLKTNSLSDIKHRRFPKLIMDFVDVDSDKWLQYSKYTKFPYSWIYRLESVRLANYERKIAEVFDYSIFVSEKEVEIFKRKNPEIRNVAAVSNGVDIEFFNPGLSHLSFEEGDNKGSLQHSEDDKKPILLFTGAMDYYANVDGVIWFCMEIFPRIKKKYPSSQFYIVGSDPDRKVQKLADNDGVIVTGFVKDIRRYYKMADLCVIPLRIARGIQNKILEAMAFGVPVVATAQTIAGIKAVPGKDVEIAENTDEFVAKTIQILHNERQRQLVGENGRNVVKTYYDWSTNIGCLESILEDMQQDLPSR